MASKDNQILPSKEQGLFRQVVKYYETKQYKKALKAADQVLKKFPDHGETLSMKVHKTAYPCLPRLYMCLEIRKLRVAWNDTSWSFIRRMPRTAILA